MGGGHLLVPKSADVTVDTNTATSENNNQLHEQQDHQNSSSSEFYASLPRSHQQKSLLCCVCHEHNTTFRYEVVYKDSLKEVAAAAAAAAALGQPNSKTTTAVANNSGPEEHAHHKNNKNSTNLILHSTSPSTLTDLVRQQVTLTTSVDTDDTDDSNHEYYNFPPRHPRHGHLKWSVWRPALVTTSSSSTSAASVPTNIFPFPPSAGRTTTPATGVINSKEAVEYNNNCQRSVVHESICITTYPDYPVHLSTFTLKRVASVIKQNKGRRKKSILKLRLYIPIQKYGLCT